MGGRLRRPM